MSMRDQIETGILNAIQAADHREDSLISLSEYQIALMLDSIMASLAEAPEDTPAPVATVLPSATPALLLSPADVIAIIARDALAEATRDADLNNAFHIDECTWAAGEDYKEFREYLFRVQSLFGVRTRSITREGNRLFLVAGHPDQISAFQRAVMLIHETAQAVVADFETAEERRQFWATLGDQVANGTDESDHLAAANRAAYAASTEHLNEVHGRARNLNRTAALYSGDIFDRAAALAARNATSTVED